MGPKSTKRHVGSQSMSDVMADRAQEWAHSMVVRRRGGGVGGDSLPPVSGVQQNEPSEQSEPVNPPKHTHQSGISIPEFIDGQAILSSSVEFI